MDRDGAEFTDEGAAVAEAHVGLRELLAAAIRESTSAPRAIRISDGAGHEVATVARHDVIPSHWMREV